MSMIKDLEAAQAEASAVKAELEKAKAEAEKSNADLVAAHTLEISGLQAEVAKLIEVNGKLTADLSAAQASAVDAQAKVGVIEAERAALAAKLEKAEKALAMPAFADASMTGAKVALTEGGEATPSAGTTPTWDEFNKIKDPAARTEFWQNNEAKLREEMGRAYVG